MINCWKKRALTSFTLAALWLFAAGQPADAAFTITLSSGVSTASVTDGGTGDNDSETGGIATSGLINGINYTTIAASSNSTTGGAVAKIDTNTFKLKNTSDEVTTAATKTVTVTFSDEFTHPGGVGDLLQLYMNATNGSPGISGNVTGVLKAQILDGNTVIAETDEIVADINFLNQKTPGVYFTRPGTYTLKVTHVVTFDGIGEFNLFSESIVAAPAPHSAILALAGLPMVGLAVWMRRRKAIAPVGSVA